MEVRDPIHGLIEYDELEERVINSRAMQRLRGIHQLAMAYLVYPGAVHTRFDHSLGVMHVAGEMAESLNERYEKEHQAKLLSKEDIANVRLAALLHDVGHGPFSHVSETPLATMSEEYAKQSGLAIEKLHERITVDIIRYDQELGKILQDRHDAIISLMDSVTLPKTTVSRCVLSGPLDADKLDYLLRDSHFCGVKYGVYDLPRVLDGLRVLSAPYGDSYLVVAEETVPAVEQHLMARYQMTLQVYRHRIRRSTDILLSRAILLAAQECEEIKRLYSYGGDPHGFCTRWAAYDDRRLLDTILARCKESSAALIAECLIRRRLPLHVLDVPLTDVGTMFLQGKLAKPERRRELEARIAARLRANPDLVIVDLVQTDPPSPASAEPGIDPDSIYVETDHGLKSFREVSDLFRHFPVGGTKRVVVFAPFRETEREARRKEREGLLGELKEEMEQWGKEA